MFIEFTYYSNDLKIKSKKVFKGFKSLSNYLLKVKNVAEILIYNNNCELKRTVSGYYNIIDFLNQTEIKKSFTDIDGQKKRYSDYSVIPVLKYGCTKVKTIVKDEYEEKYTIWSELYCRPLSKFGNNNILIPIYFKTINEVKNWIEDNEW